MIRPWRDILLIAVCAMLLTACDAVSALGAPVHRYTLVVGPEFEREVQNDALAASIPVIERRLTALGLDVANIRQSGPDRMVVDIRGEDAMKTIETAVGKPNELEFRLVDDTALPSDVMQGIASPGNEILPFPSVQGSIAVRKVGRISGDRLTHARSAFDEFTQMPVVNLTFDNQGAAKLAQLTTQNVGRQMAIVIDGEVISAPILQEPILGGNLMISGGFTADEAQQLAAALSSGALPRTYVVESHEVIE